MLITRTLLCTACFMFHITSSAQTAPEYRLELGGSIGGVTYLGDFNGNLLTNMQPMGSLVARYKMDPRSAVAFSVGYGQLKGSAKDEKTYYPEMDTYSFTSSLVDVGLRYECNFWPYGTGQEYRGAKPLTPYILIGLGATVAKPDETVVAVNMPLGLGVRYKIGERLNLGVEWVMHFTGSDKLDGQKDPYGIKSSGLFKNTDCYSHLGVSLTYDLWAKCKTCHNDRD